MQYNSLLVYLRSVDCCTELDWNLEVADFGEQNVEDVVSMNSISMHTNSRRREWHLDHRPS